MAQRTTFRTKGEITMPLRPKKRVPMSPELVTFGRNFRRARLARDQTQAEIYERTGYSTAFVSAVERGKRNVSMNTASVLAKTVGSTVRDLLEEDPMEGQEAVPSRASRRA